MTEITPFPARPIVRRIGVPRPLPTAVAIPALNEEHRIAACLEAILAQCDLRGKPLPMDGVDIAVLANNCTDATADAVRRVIVDHQQRDGSKPRVHLREVSFPPEQSNAGQARRAAMDWAAELLGDAAGGLICTTDADSRVRPDWLVRTWAERARGADAVAGTVEFDSAEAASLVLPEARRLEARYSALQAEIMSVIAPEPCDPWPNHIWAWGASLAVTTDAYRAVGGLPVVPLAEDRAFVARLSELDFKVRHSLNVRVRTSCRTLGRAPGGLADLIAAYQEGSPFPCDAELQPAHVVEERARCRAFLRSIFGGRPTEAAAERLGIGLECLERVLARPHFGQAWSDIECHSQRYYITRLWPNDLPREIRKATTLLRRLKGGVAEDRYGKALAATAGLWTATATQPR